MGNDYAFSTTELQVDAYQKIWKGAILAEDFRTMLNFGNPSWGMMALLGNSNSMRGYYEGRYRDIRWRRRWNFANIYGSATV